MALTLTLAEDESEETPDPSAAQGATVIETTPEELEFTIEFIEGQS